VIIDAGATDEIVGATIVASRAGELINEVTLAMKHGIGLSGTGRNIHSYPTNGIMGCGLQSIIARWKRLDD
jgi:pyruvate/2-oxoglutarate dehydrogenase complex dihydrolipoamide dehydrogenase (E3) component